MPDQLHVPEGWTIEQLEPPGDQRLLRAPGGSAMTIDFGQRCFRFGVNRLGAAVGPKRMLMGRGWQQALVDDAVERLREVIDG